MVLQVWPNWHLVFGVFVLELFEIWLVFLCWFWILSAEILNDQFFFGSDSVWFLQATVIVTIIMGSFDKQIIWLDYFITRWSRWYFNFFSIAFYVITHSSSALKPGILKNLVLCCIITRWPWCHISSFPFFVPKSKLCTLSKWKFWNMLFSLTHSWVLFSLVDGIACEIIHFDVRLYITCL